MKPPRIMTLICWILHGKLTRKISSLQCRVISLLKLHRRYMQTMFNLGIAAKSGLRSFPVYQSSFTVETRSDRACNKGNRGQIPARLLVLSNIRRDRSERMTCKIMLTSGLHLWYSKHPSDLNLESPKITGRNSRGD